MICFGGDRCGRAHCKCTGFWGTAAALLLMPMAGSATGGVAATSLALGAAGFARGGFSVNHMDIAPRHAGVFMGLSNTAGTIAGALRMLHPSLVFRPHADRL